MRLLIDNGLGNIDYSQYVDWSTVKISSQVNQPTTANFQVFNLDSSFQVPKRNAYVTIVSDVYTDRNLFTGFITQKPQIDFIGISRRASSFNFQHQSYTIPCTSDEWLLNSKVIPFIPTLVNQTMGQILTRIAEALVPDFFDFTNVDAGDYIPIFVYDSTKTWSQLAKQFADSILYRYEVIGKKIHFHPYGDQSLGVAYDDSDNTTLFDPFNLKTSILQVLPVNDATIIGDVEAQNIHKDYFIGDGFTGNFPFKHKTWQGDTAILLQEDWTGTDFDTSKWTVTDPESHFDLAGQLNIIGGESVGLGVNTILGNNGVELAGSLNLQHGQFTFIDTCKGILGGLYSQATLTQADCLAGFYVAPGISLGAPSVYGTSGIEIRPILTGFPVGIEAVRNFPVPARTRNAPVETARRDFPVLAETGSAAFTTNHNCSYLLQTLITSSKPTRYSKVYRDLAGNSYGGAFDNTASVTITWLINEIFVLTPQVLTEVLRYTVTVPMIPFVLYAPINNDKLNLLVAGTLLAKPPQGALKIKSFKDAAPGQLPPDTIAEEQSYVLGFGFDKQQATIGQSNNLNQLQFYSDALPGPGARIEIMTWESQQAIARVIDPVAIAAEGVVFGDDGVREVIVSSLSPLPRTSVDCENAAKAMISDKKDVQYQGSYTVSSSYWDGSRNQYPKTGRFLNVNSPQRNINSAKFLVNQIDVTFAEAKAESLVFSFQFGQDQILTKLLQRFVKQPNLLTTVDVASPPLAQSLATLGTNFLADFDTAKITNITGSTVTIDLGSTPATGAEIRRADTGWTRNDANLITRIYNRAFTLPRSDFEHTYFIRQVNGSKYSRHTTVLRLVYPLVPNPPSGLWNVSSPTVSGSGSDASFDPLHPILTLGINGDIRNIYAIQIRDVDNVTVLYERVFGGYGDLSFTFDNSAKLLRTISVYAYFSNLLGELSPGVNFTLNIPAPTAPTILNIDNNGQVLNVNLDNTINPLVTQTEVQSSDDSSFLTALIIGLGVAAAIGIVFFHINPITVVTKFFRARRHDLLGAGPWSSTSSKTLSIPVPPPTLQWYSGTLSPDTRPTTLVSGDAYKAFFTATDFIHSFAWTGSSWLCLDTDHGSIVIRDAAPSPSNGWALCNGSVVSRSLPDGSVTTHMLPNLSTGAYPKGGTSYSGPSPTFPVAPTISGTTDSTGSHTHPYTPDGSVGSTLPDHHHIATNTATSGAKDIGGHDWGDISGGSAAILAPSVTGGGSASVAGSALISGGANMPSHAHGFSTLPTSTSGESDNHSHGFFDAVDFGTSTLVFIPTTGGSMQVVQSLGGSVLNNTDIQSVDHNHDFDITGNSSDYEAGGPLAIDFSSLTVDTSGLTVDTSGLGITVGDVLVPHYHILDSISGTVASLPIAVTSIFSGSPDTTDASGSHTHGTGTLTVGDTGEPTSMTVLFYYRL